MYAYIFFYHLYQDQNKYKLMVQDLNMILHIFLIPELLIHHQYNAKYFPNYDKQNHILENLDL